VRFLLQLLQQAWFSSVTSMGTTTLAIIGGLLYPVSDLFSDLRKNGWTLEIISQHWRTRLKNSVFIAIFWWAILFSFHLFYQVPQQIRSEAAHVSIPEELPPLPPPNWYEKNSLSMRSRTTNLHPYDLTGNRRKEFVKWLGKSQKGNKDVLRIGCTSWSEASCVAAGKFLILFSEAGWSIDLNRVFRMEPQIPIDGMAMVSGGEIPDFAKNLPPHLGFWKAMDPSQATIYQTFRHMKVPISFSTDASLPPNVLGIYFGPEPHI